MPISDLDGLRQHLQWAIELEHSTLPPYLCALYSIRQGANPEAAEILRSLVVEEMLHMTLAANLLNAVGGVPQLDRAGFLPTYPAYLPHSNRAFRVALLPFSPDCIRALMQVERPEEEGAPPEDDRYETIAQFYQAIEQGLMKLCRELGPDKVFIGSPTRQIRHDSFPYAGSGKVIGVSDLGSALEALLEIVEQGEGFDHGSVWDGDRNMFHPERDEVGHFFRLEQILAGRYYQRGDTPQSGPTGARFEVDWEAVHQMRPNPRSSDHPVGSPVRAAMSRFNQAYSAVLGSLQAALDGHPEQLADSLGAMYGLRDMAKALMRIPVGKGPATAGPSFEHVAPEHRSRGPGEAGIWVQPNGPYIVRGGVPLVRKRIIRSELNEALTWAKDETVHTGANYALCRCGHSAHKPFCDGSHSRVGFDGTETADTDSTTQRQTTQEAGPLRVTRDLSLCSAAAFCVNRFGKLPELLPGADDVRVRSQVIGVIEHCPSGSLCCEIRTTDAGGAESWVPVEPDLPRAIAVTDKGPLWVTGGLPIERADGAPMEVRNRVVLCRCGQSGNKPLCDGSHRKIDFQG